MTSGPLEQLRDNFYRWEARGRGTGLYDAPVHPAPPFLPFPGHRVQLAAPADDGRRPNIFSRLAGGAKRMLQMPASAHKDEAIEEPEPDWLGEENPLFVEFPLLVPEGFNPPPHAFEHFLTSLHDTSRPIAFEVLGFKERVEVQLVADAADAADLEGQLQSHFPLIRTKSVLGSLESLWDADDEAEDYAVVEFGLGEPFMLPLASGLKADPLVGLVGAMGGLQDGEAAVYQVVFAPINDPWEESILASVTKRDGKPFFDDGAILVKGASEKVSKPLYAVNVKIGARAETVEDCWSIIRRLAANLRLLARHGGNLLVPLRDDGYGDADLASDLVARRSRRPGMILNLDELLGLAHLPSPAVESKALRRIAPNTRPAPEVPARSGSVSLGVNEHEGEVREVRLSLEHRLRHTHVIGSSGTGKSTLLLRMIRQDMERGAGFAVLDPHGDLIDAVLGAVPEDRISDVVVLDPSDELFSTGFNVLSAAGESEKIMLASDLVSVFRRLSSSWGDQMNSVLGNAIQAFLEHESGGTLLEMRRFLIEPKFRESFLEAVVEPHIVYYWRHTFPQLGAGKSIGPILTRLDNFLAPKPIRCMVGQSKGLDVGGIMDSGKILLAKLSQGLIGTENSRLLGCLLVMKLQMAAIARQRVDQSERRPFWCYIDEFQDFITPRMADILSGARKYGLGLVLAHQQLKHLERDDEVGASVLANTYTRIVFRASDDDARSLEKGFSHFGAKDIQNLKIGEALVRLGSSEVDFNLRVPEAERSPAERKALRKQEVIDASRRSCSAPRREVEALLAEKLRDAISKPKPIPVPAEAQPPEPGETQPVSDAPAENIQGAAGEDAVAAKPDTSEAVALQPGKGGEAHKRLQASLKEQSELLGFRTIVEAPVGSGRESVDLLLSRNELRIACEISQTTSIRHEIANARKCFKEGFDYIVLLSDSGPVRRRTVVAVRAAFEPEEAERIQVLSSDAFIAFLEGLPAHADTPRRTRGFRVKRTFVPLTTEERRKKTEAAFRILKAEMRQPPP